MTMDLQPKRSHPRGPSKTSARAIRQRMREREVLQYRLQHLPYDEISRKMQMPLSTVKDHARRGMDALLPLEYADEIRKRDMADLDELSRTYKPLAVKGDHVAAKRCIEIIELRERLAGNITRSQSFNAEVIVHPLPRINVVGVHPTVKYDSEGHPINTLPPPDMNGPRPMNRNEHTDPSFPHRFDATAAQSEPGPGGAVVVNGAVVRGSKHWRYNP